jgi:hypothetical protein
MRSIILVSGAIVGIVLLAPPPSRAQDSLGEVEATVKGYLASHPDEVAEIVRLLDQAPRDDERDHCRSTRPSAVS